jgi:excisionase family DNA binding protein
LDELRALRKEVAALRAVDVAEDPADELTIAEAERVSRWSAARLYRAINDGRLAAVRHGRAVRVKRSDLLALVGAPRRRKVKP